MTGETSETREVEWCLGATTIAGTLIQPLASGRLAAVAMVAGSGPTDRDWNSPLLPGANGSARLIAEALGRAGFASLRYDKRVAGPHARENAKLLMGTLSMQSHVDELAGAVRMLADQPSVSRNRIFGLGSSEGTLHCLNYQLHAPKIPFAGLILTGLPGRAIGAVARSQLAAQAAGVPNGDALLALYDAAIARFLAGEPVAPDPSLPQAVQTLLRGLEAPVNLPFARELWMVDPVTLLQKVSLPVLVIIGKKDVQVDWRADGDPLRRAAAGNHDVTFLFPENANHVLKEEQRSRAELSASVIAASYNAPDTHIDRQVITAIESWLTAHV